MMPDCARALRRFSLMCLKDELNEREHSSSSTHFSATETIRTSSVLTDDTSLKEKSSGSGTHLPPLYQFCVLCLTPRGGDGASD